MAEIIGTLASIVQIVDTALKARDYIKDCIQDFRHAPEEQQKLLAGMNDLRLLLQKFLVEELAAPYLSRTALSESHRDTDSITFAAPDPPTSTGMAAEIT
ncbi:hypothetical protein FB451DRAFT_1549507 [Mycena latifolia]|nr:hypothetical protein FB451DRAFT_1549507 [Mycena latifolia]